MGERRAQRLQCAPFDEKQLKRALDGFRFMTRQHPKEFQPVLQTSLSECGVALVVCPHFPKTKAHGATFWLGRNKAVLMITIRGKWADVFWFSLFHEIGHILLHGRQEVILEDDEKDEREKEADIFAADHLIPPDAYKYLVQKNLIRLNEIEAFANDIGIHPGIVVGRLQHEKRLKPACGNGLRIRYDWSKSE